MKPWEKKAWIFVTFVLLMAEAYALQSKEDADRLAIVEAQSREDQKFAEVLLANQLQFEETVRDVGKVFDKTKVAADTATEAVNTITGGKGWAYIDVDTTLVNGRVTDTLQVMLHVINSRVLRNVQLHVVDYKAFQADRDPINPQTIIERDAVNTQMGDLNGLVMVFRPIGIDTKRKELDYFITFFALNGTWMEELHYKRDGDKLQHAYRVVWQDFPPNGSAVGMKERVIREDITSDYPRVGGKVNWEAPLKR